MSIKSKVRKVVGSSLRLTRSQLRKKNQAFHSKMTGLARKEFASKKSAANKTPLQRAQKSFRANPRLKVKSIKAATRSNFPLARKMKGTKLGSAMRQGAAAEIRRSRMSKPKLKGKASGGHVGIAKFHASTGKPFVGSAKGRSARLVRISRHKGITSTKALGRITL